MHNFLIALLPCPSGLCPDWAEWDPNQPVQNAREAMQQADDWLGVPQVSYAADISQDVNLGLLHISWVGLELTVELVFSSIFWKLKQTNK